MSEPDAAPTRGQPRTAAAPDWYPDPTGRFAQRYWDGVRWSTYVSDAAGRMDIDALTSPPSAVAPDASQTDKASPRPRRNPAAPIVVLAGAFALALGSVLPWATVSSPIFHDDKVSGIRGDGQITLLLAIALSVLGIIGLVTARSHRALFIVTLVIAAVAALTCAIDLNEASRVARRQTGIPVNANVSYGLYLALAGCACTAVGAIIGLTKRRRQVNARRASA